MTSKKAKPKRREPDVRESYHHGTLRDALIRATDEILSERGAVGFTLREAARRAGVSVASPSHHFGSAAGLLTEVAITGFEELTRMSRDAANSETTPAARLRAQGMAYVRFAIAYPGRFQLMFRHDLLLTGDDRLTAAGQAAYADLEISVRAYLAATDDDVTDEVLRSTVLGAWSIVHGFAHLALDGKFKTLSQTPALSDFVSDSLPGVLLRAWPDGE
jgi:AcrR family transcriptional regulator